MIMDLSIRTVKKIEISEVKPLFDDKNEEDWYQRSIKITFQPDPLHPSSTQEMMINCTTQDKYNCEEAAKKDLGVNIA